MLRSNISYAIFYNIKIKIDSYDDMPLEKKTKYEQCSDTY